MMETLVNPIAFSLLLTSLFVLRFRGWRRPAMVALYFVFFAAVEVVATHFFLPPGAFGSGLGILCLVLTVPVVIATYLVWRHEKRQGEGD